ncbi:MAG: S8 family peptidase [Lachnospiraceae bacterium]|nr:S8 family peptidase [Lachnospiraceae bacterium]
MDFRLFPENGFDEIGDCREAAVQNDYADYILTYNGDREGLQAAFQGQCLTIIDDYLAVVSIPRNDIDLMSLIPQFYSVIPKCYGLMDPTSLEASGIIQVQNQPVLSLSGSGTLIGVIDSGIDYTNPIFRNADGTTRIVSLWDQSVQSGIPPEGFFYGSEYGRTEINRALMTDDPYEQVPSIDDQGHGTFVAGIMAGGRDEAGNYTGIAPDAELLVVKLKSAKEYLKEYYYIGSEEEAYQETDLILAVYYLQLRARREQKPISIFLGLGTNGGDHSGRGPMQAYLNRLATAPGIAITIPSGNEGNARHHTSGILRDSERYRTIEINVGAGDPGIYLEIWGNTQNVYAVGFESPYGEVVERIPPRFYTRQQIPLYLERTVIDVSYSVIEGFTGRQLIVVRLTNPTEGIWRLRLYVVGTFEKNYQIWLPIRNFTPDDLFFLQPTPDTTLTEPSAADACICTTAYNHLTNALYFESGRGYTSLGMVKPDLAAPGVDVYGPSEIAGRYVRRSGTSVAAAHTAGAVALLMEWGNLRGNIPLLNGIQIKQYLTRGARRAPAGSYPNELWGNGALDLYGAFETLQQREEF